MTSTRATTPGASTISAHLRSKVKRCSSSSTCMRERLSRTTSLPSPFTSLRCQLQGVDLGSLGRGHAPRCIDLYPVRAQAPSSHNRYSRVPKARKRRWRTTLLLGCKEPSSLPVANRLAVGAASPMNFYSPILMRQTLRVAPSGMTPSSTKRQNAIASFRANATMPTLRPRMPVLANRSCHHSASLLLG